MQWKRSPGKKGSHFNPYSDLFAPSERIDVLTSTVCWFIMVAVLVYLSLVVGPAQMLVLYGLPYLVSEKFHFQDSIWVMDCGGIYEQKVKDKK